MVFQHAAVGLRCPKSGREVACHPEIEPDLEPFERRADERPCVAGVVAALQRGEEVDGRVRVESEVQTVEMREGAEEVLRVPDAATGGQHEREVRYGGVWSEDPDVVLRGARVGAMVDTEAFFTVRKAPHKRRRRTLSQLLDGDRIEGGEECL